MSREFKTSNVSETGQALPVQCQKKKGTTEEQMYHFAAREMYGKQDCAVLRKEESATDKGTGKESRHYKKQVKNILNQQL